MLMKLYDAAGHTSPAAIIISVSLMLFCGFLMTRLTKKLKLPNVTAYIVAGILLGPFCLNAVPGEIISGMSFLSDIALAFIAFGTGEFFRLSVLKKNGPKVVVITVFEALTASVVVFLLTFFILRLDLGFSIVLAALASATAPASTMMTIRQTGAKGDFVNTLLQVVALDDIVGLLAYSIAISIALSSSGGGGVGIVGIIKPVLVNLGVLLLGGLFGALMKLFMTKRRTDDNRLIIAVAFLFTFCGVCTTLDISPLLGCMSMGTVYINLTDDDKLFRQLSYFSPPILLLFFVRSGLNFRLDSLTGESGAVGSVPLIVIGVLYFVVRIFGKYAGAFSGCLIVGKSPKIRNYLGLALIPQAGVAIGLASLGARTLGGETGQALETVILASSVLYELLGPACAKASLYLSGACSDESTDVGADEGVNAGTGEAGAASVMPGVPARKNEVEILIEEINRIRESIPDAMTVTGEDEKAFTDAAVEQFGVPEQPLERRRQRQLNRR